MIQVAAGLDEPGAGPSYSVRRLAAGLMEAGTEVELLSLAGWRGAADDSVKPVPRRFKHDYAAIPVLGQLGLSSALAAALRAEVESADIVHGHGLWLAPNIYPATAAASAGRPFVLSPRGMLGPAALEFSRARKMAVWRLAQGRAARSAACIHATSVSEYEEVRAFGLGGPVAVIPNGVDIPPLGAARQGPGRTLLTLGRVHPKKGLVNLVRAWAAVAQEHPDWRLRIVGPDELGHAQVLADEAARLQAPRLSIEPALYGEARTATYQEADIFVLPTLNENFALTVAEALAAATPVVATKGAPWSGLADHDCGWWIDLGVEPLGAALRTAMSIPDERRRAMGLAGRAWMQADFSWTSVAGQMRTLYDWLLAGGEAPNQVRLD